MHFRPLQSYVSGRSDLAPKLDMGVYVGTHGRNGDALIMTKEGVIKGGSLKRLTVEERCRRGALQRNALEDEAKVRGGR